MKEENQINESNKCNKKPCLLHKILGLKGLSMIYKVLSVIVILVMLYILGTGWYEIIKEKLPMGKAILWTFQVVISYLFYALILFTVAKILKVLRKIKYAVNNK